MTLQSSGPITLGDVLAELQTTNPARANPIRLGDSDVLALAGLSGPACSLSDLYGKTASGSAGSFTLVASDAYGQANAGSNTASATSTATPYGASGAVSYSWTFVSGLPMTLSGQATATCTFQHTVGAGSEVTATYQVSATDGLGRVATAQVNVDLLGDTSGGGAR